MDGIFKKRFGARGALARAGGRGTSIAVLAALAALAALVATAVAAHAVHRPARPRAAAIAISGSVTGLQPGVARPLNLLLRNTTKRKLRMRRLKVTARRISAPRATSRLPCRLADFSIRQYSGRYPLVLLARRKRRLSTLKVATAKWPRVMLINRPRNQDGCLGARVTLTYAGRGTTR